MSTALTTVSRDGGAPSALHELRDRANREYRLAEASLSDALQHVIRCGEALLEARDSIEFMGWGDWVEQNYFEGSISVAAYYMRIAEYREVIADLPSVSRALKQLRGMPPLRRPGYEGYDESVKDEARSLVAAGLTRAEVARAFGVSHQTMRCWVDPEVLRRQREQNRAQSKARKERRREEKQRELNRAAERAARKAGGALAESYSLAHRLEDQLAAAERAATDPEAKAALAEAVSLHHKLKDRVVRALGVGR